MIIHHRAEGYDVTLVGPRDEVDRYRRDHPPSEYTRRKARRATLAQCHHCARPARPGASTCAACDEQRKRAYDRARSGKNATGRHCSRCGSDTHYRPRCERMEGT